MSDDMTGFTDDQLGLMNALHDVLNDALYSDALLALEVVMMELLCGGAPSKNKALSVADAIAKSLARNIDVHFDEINDPVGHERAEPVGKVTLQ